MKSIHEARRANLAQLIDERFESNKSAFARKLNFSQPSAVYRMLSPDSVTKRLIGQALARRIEVVCELPENWLDQDRAPETSSGVSVPILEYEAPAEAECTGSDPLANEMQLNLQWVQNNLIELTSPRNLRVITAHGDSMEETYSFGDLLLVDIGIKDVRADGVYVFRREGEVFVKRLQRRMDGSLLVISDSRRYEPQIVVARERKAIVVLGRVVYAWRGLNM